MEEVIEYVKKSEPERLVEHINQIGNKYYKKSWFLFVKNVSKSILSRSLQTWLDGHSQEVPPAWSRREYSLTLMKKLRKAQ